MQTTNAFLDAVKAKTGVPSDYAIAKILGVTQQTVSRYRVKKDFLGDSTAIRVAGILEIDAAIVIACAHAERAKSEQEREVWEHIVKALGGLAASIFLAVGVAPVPSHEAHAATQHPEDVYYVKSRRRPSKNPWLGLLSLSH